MKFPLAVFLSLMPTLFAHADDDPRGPIPTVQMRVEAIPGRVEAKDFRFDAAKIPARPGKAQWIWLHAEKYPNAKPTATFFRREIELAAAPQKAHVWFSADAHARLYINGQLVGRGPDDGGQDYPGQQTGKVFVNFRDLTPFFRAGKNVIAAEVFSADAMEGRYNTTGKSAFLLEASLQLPSGKIVDLQADNSWRAVPSDSWKFADAGSGRALQFDGTVEPQGWRIAGFDDSAWPFCAPETSARPELAQSQLPARMEAIYPAQGVVRASENVKADGGKITFGSAGKATVRYDRVLSGFIGFKVRAATGGTVLNIEPNEPNAPGHHRHASAKLREGEQSFELPFYDSFSVINLTASAPLEILDVRATFVSIPVSYAGDFSCSDEELNKIWQASRWLTQICQQTHHLDSPHHQEPICDPGDYLIIALNNYNAFGQPHLAKQDLRKYAWLLQQSKYRPFHTSYALLWLQMLVQYEDYTGDSALVKELTPTVHALLDQFATYRGKNGILSEAPDYMFMDWVNIAGFGAHHPPAVIGQGYMTTFYYRALQDGIRVAKLNNDAARVTKYEVLQREIADAYNRELWDEKAGLYRDGKPFVTSVKPAQWLPADKDIETHSTQNNVLAVLYDLAPRERQAPIMRRLLEGEMNTQPYYMHFVFAAMQHAGVFNEYAADQMRRWHIEDDTQSFREMWGTGDYSHAWQCTPLFQMSGRVLGIAPAAPGFEKVQIAPQPCDLQWAKGSVPTPHGKVSVSWTRSATKFTLEAILPQGMLGSLEIPVLGKNAKLTVNGRPVPIGKDALSVAVAIAGSTGGKHEAILTFEAPPALPKPAPWPLETKTAAAQAAFENETDKNNLVKLGNAALLRVDEKAAHNGGGINADAIHNGTTKNGEGAPNTQDDGVTFRGYGEGDFLTFQFDTTKNPRGFDITGITTFAGHADARASQSYSISVAFANDPTKFIPWGKASVQSNGGASRIKIQNPNGGVLENGALKASGVSAIRFQFQNGPQGFNVYREFCISGTAAKE